jgi:hypothetical protein
MLLVFTNIHSLCLIDSTIKCEIKKNIGKTHF